MFWTTYRGRVLHQTLSGVYVYQNARYRWLTFGDDAIQTCLHRRHPEIPVLPYVSSFIVAARLWPGRVCLLGLGGGGVLHALKPSLYGAQVHAVEVHAEVIQLARDYFMIDSLEGLHLVHEDALSFVNHATQRYEHLFVDIFTTSGFPVHCDALNFFQQCHRLLSETGVFSFNLVGLNKSWPLVHKIREVFDGATLILPVKKTSNVVVLAAKGRSILFLLEKLREEGVLKRVVWDSQVGWIGFR